MEQQKKLHFVLRILEFIYLIIFFCATVWGILSSTKVNGWHEQARFCLFLVFMSGIALIVIHIPSTPKEKDKKK